MQYIDRNISIYTRKNRAQYLLRLVMGEYLGVVSCSITGFILVGVVLDLAGVLVLLLLLLPVVVGGVLLLLLVEGGELLLLLLRLLFATCTLFRP